MSLAAAQVAHRDGDATAETRGYVLSDTGRMGPVVATAGDDLSVDDRQRMRQQVATWRDQLIDLSRRNRLLHYAGRATGLWLTAPSTHEILDRLDRDGWAFAVPPPESTEPPEPPASTEPPVSTATAAPSAAPVVPVEVIDLREPGELVTSAVSAEKLAAALGALARRSATEYLDKGIRVLYVGCGFLSWEITPGERSESPLLLVPVALERATVRAPWRLVGTDDDPVVNPALIVKLEQAFGAGLDIDPDETDYQAVRRAAERLAAAHGPTWTVSDRAVLSTFSFHKEAMYRDLLANEDTIVGHPIVQALALVDRTDDDLRFDPVPEASLDELAPPEELHAILDADATQAQCVVAARDGRSFVMDGPPGTGKSQTIANMIAELLAQGCSVLFVSEKAAALDVVKRRLDEAHLGPFVLELHSHRATRKEVARTLGKAVSQQVKPPPPLTEGALVELRRRRSRLSAHAAAMNERRDPIGRTLHEVLGRLGRLAETGVPMAPLPAAVDAHLSADVLAGVLDTSRRLAGAWDPVTDEARFVWRSIRDLDGPSTSPAKVQTLLDDARLRLAHLTEVAGAAADDTTLPLHGTLDDIQRLHRIAEHLADEPSPSIPTRWLVDADLTAARDRASDVRRRAADQATRVAALSAITPAWPQVDPEFAAGVHQALTALAELRPPFVVSPGRTVTSLSTALASCPRWIHQLRALATEARELSAVLGLPDQSQTLGRCSLLADLGRSVAAGPAPPGEWFAPATAAAVREAAETLRGIVEQWRAADAEVRATFHAEIDRLDIETFYDGPHDTTPQLSRWTSRGRGNRHQLEACAVSGEVDDREIDALPTVRRRQSLLVALRAAEAEDGRAARLAPFYAGPGTDFERLFAALAVADDVVRLVGDAPPAALVERLARGTVDRADLGQRPRVLQSHLLQVVDEIGRDLPEAPELVTAPLSVLASWLAAVVERLAPLDARLRPVAAATGVEGLTALVDLARQRAELAAVAARHLAARADDVAALGAWGEGSAHDVDHDALDAALSWAATLRDLVGGPVDERTAAHLLAATTQAAPLAEAADRFTKQFDAVLELFEPTYAATLRADAGGRLSDIGELLGTLAGTLDDLDTWRTHRRTTGELTEAGLGEVLAFCQDHRLAAERLAPTVERAVLTAWAEAVLEGDDRIGTETAEERDALVGEFRALDRRATGHARARVIEACNERRPSAGFGQAAILQREAEKKIKHRPIRTLLDDTRDVVLDVMPCFMMSPLAISQFLPTDLVFDAVIFDEASQVRPGDAVNAIYRGRQLIVAGDGQQLPPTAFFDVVTGGDDDEYDEDAPEEFDSVLELALGTAGLPTLPLRWHYRSRHESLIAFSNKEIYEGRLVTFPGALERGPDVGIELFPVAGVYDRGGRRTNPIEADAVVARVLHHATEHPTLTLGVVAFSEAQASEIELRLDLARADRPDLDPFFATDRLDGFFVRNLENVQGDERDVIVFSVGYGPDEHDRLTMHFGPLNGPNGHRRLNVAVTRARRRVEVVASFGAERIPSDIAVRGVQLLRRYLEFAARGPVALTADPTGAMGTMGAAGATALDADVQDDLAADVAAVLAARGYDVVTTVGQLGYRIDLAVRDPERPGRFALGIECDGARYHESKVARDRDRLRHEVLEGLGWRLHRIWGRSWYARRQSEITRLVDAVEAARREGPLALAGRAAAGASSRSGDADAEPDVVEDDAPEIEVIDLDAPPEWAEPYELARLVVDRRTAIDAPSSRDAMARLMVELVRVEGPISDGLLTRRLCDAWGMPATAKAKEAVQAVLTQTVRRGSLERPEAGFVRLAGASVHVRVPEPGDPRTQRQVADVASCELELALELMMDDVRVAEEDDLLFAVSRLFGWGRRGSEITKALETALGRLVAREHVVRVERLIRLAE
jgi:hypothetical protein